MAGIEAHGLLGELATSLRVIAVARADIRVEVDGGVSLLVGEAAHAVKYAAESVQNGPKSVVLCRKVAASFWEIGYRQGIDWVLNCLFWPVWPNFEKSFGLLVTGYRHGLS